MRCFFRKTVVLFFLLLVLGHFSSLTAAYKKPTPEELAVLRKGGIVTDGGYLKKGVWGRMEGVIEAPPEVAWRLFINANNWTRYRFPSLLDSYSLHHQWIPDLSKIRSKDEFYKVYKKRVPLDPQVDRRKGQKWTGYNFQYYDVPWPVSNRWMVVKNFNDETQAHHKNIYRTSWTLVRGNVETLNGTIILEPFEGNPRRTHMQYNVESNPGDSVPKFLVKWAVKKTMPDVMKSIQREAAKQYRHSKTKS